MQGASFWVVNKHAGRAFREEFLNYIDKCYPEFFDGVPHEFDEILGAVHQMAQTDLDTFIKENCGEYDIPCFDFEINASELN